VTAPASPASPSPSSPGLAAVLAVDVGNSKTDVALVAADGRVLGAVRGPTASHQQVGAPAAFARLVAFAEEAASGSGLLTASRPLANLVVYAGAGVDLPSDERLIARHLEQTGLARHTIVTNDCHAGLRAGTAKTWGVCVIAGSGMNCLGVDPAGREARVLALGEISGDWGGGGAIGLAGLEAAVRAEDGRGPVTLLARTVPAHFGLRRPTSVAIAMYRGRIPFARHRELAPVVVATAVAGDPVARAIMDRQADEAVAWAAAAIRRLRLQRRAPDVVLAGGVFRADDPAFFARIEAGVRAVAKGATMIRMTAPPVVGAALLGLDAGCGGATPSDVEARLRADLTHKRFDATG
jgi:N-acetylglucosamine kinase-like BadF-type ATPase